VAKASKKTAPKKQQSKDEPLKINGSLDDVLRASFSKPKQEKKDAKKD